MIFKYKGRASSSWESTEGGNFFRFLKQKLCSRKQEEGEKISHFFILKFDKAQKSSEKENEKETRNEFHIEIK